MEAKRPKEMDFPFLDQKRRVRAWRFVVCSKWDGRARRRGDEVGLQVGSCPVARGKGWCIEWTYMRIHRRYQLDCFKVGVW